MGVLRRGARGDTRRAARPTAAREHPSASPKLDAAGATTVTAALALLVYGCTRAEEAGLAAPSTLGSLGLSAALFAAFVSIEARAKHPLVPLGIFRSRVLVGSGLV